MATLLSKLAETLKSIAIICSFLLVFGLICILVIQIIWPKRLIEIISVPEALQKRGYTAAVLAQQISEGTKLIAELSKCEFNVAYPRKPSTPKE